MTKFQVYKDRKGEYRWRFISKNGRIIAVSSESYHNKKDCYHGIDLLESSHIVEDLTSKEETYYAKS